MGAVPISENSRWGLVVGQLRCRVFHNGKGSVIAAIDLQTGAPLRVEPGLTLADVCSGNIEIAVKDNALILRRTSPVPGTDRERMN